MLSEYLYIHIFMIIDPEIAKHLRKNTLRAKFGVSKIKNAIHCTDLPEDGPLEVPLYYAPLLWRHDTFYYKYNFPDPLIKRGPMHRLDPHRSKLFFFI